MVYDLVMPQPLSRRSLERDQAVREEIHSVTLAAVEIGFRRFRCHKKNAALVVERLTGPGHDARSGLVRVRGPGIVTHFAGSWNQMEYPTPQTRSDIERADRAGTAHATDNQEIPIRDPRRVQADVRCAVDIQPRAQVKGTVLTKAPDRLARFRIQGVKMIARPGEESLFAAGL